MLCYGEVVRLWGLILAGNTMQVGVVVNRGRLGTDIRGFRTGPRSDCQDCNARLGSAMPKRPL